MKQDHRELFPSQDRSSLRAQKYVASAEVLMLGLSPDRRVTTINPKGCQVLGYPCQEIVGKDWFVHFLPSDISTQVGQIFDSMISGELEPVTYYENEILCKDGQRRIIAWHNGVILDEKGHLQEVVCTGVDITEKRYLARQNQELSDQLLTILEGLEAVVYVSDMETYEILYLNGYTKRIFGDGVGQKCFVVLQNGRSEPCTFCTNSQLVDEHGQPTGPLVWEFQNTLNNSWYKISDKAITWIDGRIVRLEIATDITDLKKTQSENLALITKLEKALDEVDALRGIIPICSYCKKIRDDQGFWSRVEKYIAERSGAEFSHGICPECKTKNYPDM